MTEAGLRSAFAGYDTSTLLWNGLVGRTIVNAGGGSTPSSETVISGWRTAGNHPKVWLVGLITNDYGRTETNWRADMKTLLDLIAVDPVTRVLWVGPAYGPQANATVLSQTPTMRAMLADIAATSDTAKKPAGMDFRYFDLHAAFQAIDTTGMWDGSDNTGRHMTTAGYTKRLELIKTWFDSVMAGGSGSTDSVFGGTFGGTF